MASTLDDAATPLAEGELDISAPTPRCAAVLRALYADKEISSDELLGTLGFLLSAVVRAGVDGPNGKPLSRGSLMMSILMSSRLALASALQDQPGHEHEALALKTFDTIDTAVGMQAAAVFTLFEKDDGLIDIGTGLAILAAAAAGLIGGLVASHGLDAVDPFDLEARFGMNVHAQVIQLVRAIDPTFTGDFDEYVRSGHRPAPATKH